MGQFDVWQNLAGICYLSLLAVIVDISGFNVIFQVNKLQRRTVIDCCFQKLWGSRL